VPLALIAALALAAAPPPAGEPAAVAVKPPPPRWWHVALGVVILEAVGAGHAALASRWPEATGWTTVALAPTVFVNPQGGLVPGAEGVQLGVAAASLAGVGLYDALELRSDRYSRSQRFWRDELAFHGWLAVNVVTELVLRSRHPEAPAPPPRVSIRAGPGGLSLAGRF
jgi:hypothetical protein